MFFRSCIRAGFIYPRVRKGYGHSFAKHTALVLCHRDGIAMWSFVCLCRDLIRRAARCDGTVRCF